MKNITTLIYFINLLAISVVAKAQNTFPSSGTFTLPNGKTIVITYEVTVNANACASPAPVSLSAQGTVSVSNFASVLTDDPAIVGTTNPTIVAFNSPVINAGSTISATAVCSGGSVTLNASCPNSATLNWYNASTGGASLSTASPFSPTNLTSNTSYYATCTDNSCEGARTLVGSLTVTALPTAPTAANKIICSGFTATLTASCASGSPFWYTTSTGGAGTAGGTFTTPTLTNATTAATITSYFAECQSGGSPNCVSTSRTQVDVTVHPQNLPLVSPTNDFTSGNTIKKAVQSISATNKIISPANVIYQAGDAIMLNAGFEAGIGSVFKSEIAVCN